MHRDALTTKLRVAYYASSRPTKDILSLNDFFCSGPAIIPVIFRVLLRFREKMIALKVSYMYSVQCQCQTFPSKCLLNSFYNNNNILLKIRNITYYITFPPQTAYELIEAERSDDILQVQSLSIYRWTK